MPGESRNWLPPTDVQQSTSTTRQGGAPPRGKVYVAAEKDKPQPVELVLGISDGSFTEVLGGDLDTGQEVIIGVNLTASKRAAKRFAF